MTKLISSAALAAALCGCAASSGGGSGDDAPDSPDADPARPDADTTPRPDAPPPPPACADGSESVYVIDRNEHLSRFEPATLTFTDLGLVSCSSSSARPFSMSVDRAANAWVLFSDYKIRLVSTTDATCAVDAFQLPDPFEQYGMGFTAEGDGELLYISGNTFINLLNNSPSNPASLGRVVPSSRATTEIGPLAGWPELSGNSLGQLFAFYPPGPFTAPARIVEVDRATATEDRAFELTGMTGEFEKKYAFAHWGGDLWVFIKPLNSTNSEVWRFDLPPDGDGSITKVVTDAGRVIVGAGVSICAPIVID
jgi:hypothetical protein